MKCPTCSKPQRNIGIGPRPLWHCDHCEMADTEPMTAPVVHKPEGLSSSAGLRELYDQELKRLQADIAKHLWGDGSK